MRLTNFYYSRFIPGVLFDFESLFLVFGGNETPGYMISSKDAVK